VEKILILDDDVDITTMLSDFLKSNFNPACFNDPELAYNHFQNNGPFRSVIVDLDMPKINGEKFIGLIREINPEQNITIITGVEDLDLMEHLVTKYPKCRILKKPFDLNRLLLELL